MRRPKPDRTTVAGGIGVGSGAAQFDGVCCRADGGAGASLRTPLCVSLVWWDHT